MGAINFLLLLGAVFAVGFGPTRLLLKRSRFEQYTVEATFLLTPMFACLVFTLAGYYRPETMSALEAWIFFLGGTALSIFCLVRDWQSVRELLRHHGGRILMVLGSASWAVFVLLLYFPGTMWQQYFFCGNGEFVNYAHLAALMTGHCHPNSELAVPPFFQFHRTVRYGQDIVTGLTALLSGRHPLNVVVPLSLFYRFQYALALGLIFYQLANMSCRRWLVPLLLLFDGYVLVETFSFTSSWMSSNCTLALYVVYVAILFSLKNFGWREMLLVVLANIFFLITYPEFLSLVKIFELVHVGRWLVQRRPERWRPIVLCNVLVGLLHPLLVFHQIGFVFWQTTRNAGFNMFGDPAKEPLTYLSHFLGLRYIHVPEATLLCQPWLVIVLTILVVGIILAGLYVLASRYDLQHAVGAWVVLTLLFNLFPLLASRQNSYGAVKFGTQTFFVALAAIVALGNARRALLRRLAFGVMTLWAVSTAATTINVFPSLSKHGTIFEYDKIRDTLVCNCPAGSKVAGLVEMTSLRILYLASNEAGYPFVPLSECQEEDLLRTRMREFYGLPKILPAAGSQAQPPQPVAFEGYVLVPPELCAQKRIGLDDCALLFHPDQAVSAIGGNYLFHGRLCYSSSLDVPGGHWITAENDWNPKVLTKGTRVVLRGNVLAFPGFQFPYRFRVGMKHSAWSREVVVPAPGPFQSTFHLPTIVAGSVVEFTFQPGQTLQPKAVDPKSTESRYLGFLVHSVKSLSKNGDRTLDH